MAKAAKKQNGKTILITICVILAALLVIGLAVYNRLKNTGITLRGQKAVESENFEVTGTMMPYFISSQYQSISPYFEYLGVDTSKSLKSQPCPLMEEGSWFDYIVTGAKQMVGEILSLCEAAKANGVELDDENKQFIEETVESVRATAAAGGYTLNSYLSAMFGSGMNEKDMRACLNLTELASKYSTQFTDGLTYTAEDREAYYNENKEQFMTADLYAFETKIADFMLTDTDGNPIGDAADAVAKVQEAADKFDGVKTADEFKALVSAYAIDVLGKTEEEAAQIADDSLAKNVAVNIFGEDVNAWLADAQVGDLYVNAAQKNEDDVTTYDVYLVDRAAARDETKTRDVRHLLVSNEEYEDDTEVNRIYAEWEEAGFTEDKLIELVGQYSADTGSVEAGGLYTDVAVGDMVPAFNDWLFDESRQTGDHDIVESEYGWHIMYYVGEGELAGWEADAESAMAESDYKKLVEEFGTSVAFNDKVIAKVQG